ncbi:MAG: ArsR family transcriptional regulator, partial [Hyphomicrobiaceae bacterium]
NRVLSYLADFCLNGGPWFNFNIPANHVSSVTGVPVRIVYLAVKRLAELGVIYKTGETVFGSTYSWTFDGDGAIAKLMRASRAPKGDQRELILSAIPATGATVTDIAATCGIPKTSVSRIVKSLEADGTVSSVQDGNRKLITIRGRKYD